MDPEEQELLGDYRYRNYSSIIEKALRNFESSTEWADLISSLGKLNKALQSNLKYCLLPRRLIISKRLAQCLHPALPSGVHLKALETYEIIFKIIGTKWLSRDLFLYSSGLFPLLSHAAMSVKPLLLGLYETYFLPLQRSLLPSLQAFITGLLPGLEEGSEIYDRTDALLQKLSVVIGQEVFYSSLWGSVLVSSSVRLPASLFVVSHINRDISAKAQSAMLGNDKQLAIKSLCVSVMDSNVLVQRNTLEMLLFFFPFHNCLDSGDCPMSLLRTDVIHILSCAIQTVLRRDMSLNRRLYAWLLGSDIKGGIVAPELKAKSGEDEYGSCFFAEYSKDLLVKALMQILHQNLLYSDSEQGLQVYLKPFRILISLLDKPEIGPPLVGDLFLEVIRAFYAYCRDALGTDIKLSYAQTGSQLISAIKENKTASEIVKTVNLLITSLSSDFLWDYMTVCFEQSFRKIGDTSDPKYVGRAPSVSEICTLLVFLLDVIPLELYSEVQTQYLPQMLSYMAQSLSENMDGLSLPELTQALKTCFKVLSKVQMPPAYLDMDPVSPDSSPSKESLKHKSSDETEVEVGEDPIFPPLKSEDSGIGLSASSPELSGYLRMPKVCPEKDDVWKKGGSVQKTLHCIQDLVANFASRHLFGLQLSNGISSHNKEESVKRKGHWEPKPITAPQFKQMLTDFFTPRPPVPKLKSDKVEHSPSRSPNKRGNKGLDEEWDIDRYIQNMGQMSEDCREAFAAACHFLLDCATFPVYLSEEEMEQIYSSLVQVPGSGDAGFPLWFKSLMTVCCCVKDCYIQNVAISTLLEVVNHSQSLSLVMEDRIKRSKMAGYSEVFGKLQMVTVPPVPPGVLKLIAEKTDFYPRVAHVLWNQLNMETREHHITCVELFYRLHCLAPSANICEEIICQTLLDNDKVIRLEALFRFSVIWHLTREIQGSRVTSHNRSFDRSLFVVLDSLNCADGAIGAAAQGWLVRALSLNDVARILEPVLLLLLHPKTQRTSIQSIKQKNSSEEISYWCRRKRSSLKDSATCPDYPESNSDENLPQFNTVDREAIWAEVEKDPEKMKNELTDHHILECAVPPFCEDDDKEDSEHTESADTSMGQSASENTSSFNPSSIDSSNDQRWSNGDSIDRQGSSRPFCQPNMSCMDVARPAALLHLVRTESDVTQTSESLSSDDEAELELQAIRTSKLLKQQKEKEELIEALFKHILLYLQPYDSKRVLYAFSVLEAVLKTNPKEFIEAVASTSMDTSSTAHLNLIYNLLARHQEALVGQSFYGKLQTQSPSVCPHSLLIELLTYLCLSFLRSYYPCYLKVSHRDVLGNRDVQVKSVEVLIRVISQLAAVAKNSEGKNVDFIHHLLERCKVQEFVLLSLSASMYTSQKKYELVSHSVNRDLTDDGLFEESVINFGQDQIWSEHPLQIELLKLLQVLIVLEHHLRQLQEDPDSPVDLSKEWHRGLNFQQSINAMQYVQSHAITSQGLFVSAVVRALRPEYGYGMHPPWVALVTSSLPYFGKSLGLTVAPFVAQICKNLDELVKQYENESVKMSSSACKKENISPDYPLTLLEGLTTIGHFCLLDHPAHTKKSSSSDPSNLKNARLALLEELPRIVNSLSQLWSVITRQERERRPSDLLGTIKGSSSVYFKTTKTLKQKILDFLNPLTAHLGVQLIAAVAAVWKRKRFHKAQSKAKIIPVPSESQLTLVDLVCALKTLRTDTILQLVKEVVKKPPQIKGDEKTSLVDIPMLQFSFAFIQRLSPSDMQENFQSLLILLKESVPLNLAPPGFFLLLSILNDFVTRTPNLENKKDQKDLQDVTQKILEAVGNVAGSSLEQTSWLSRNLEVKAQPQVSLDEADADGELSDDNAAAQSSMVSASAPSVYSVHALSLLAEVLATLLDMVYRSDEKEKAVPLISRLLYFVFPYLRNHNSYNAPSFRAGAQLLSSLSGYAYTKRAWKKEVLDLYMDPGFFQMDTSCIHWKSIIDHLLTHEKTMFKDLMNMPSSSLKLYPSNEQKAMLLKRQGFAVFSGELDQYHLYLPLIQERLTDNIRVGQTPIMAAQMFLFFRVLLLRIAPQHLTSLWPIMVTELIHAFVQLQDDLTEEETTTKNSKANKQKAAPTESNGPVYAEIQQNCLDLYLSACKFLDTALSFPPDKMPLFQMYRWAFVPEVDAESCAVPAADVVESHQECKPHVVRILELMRVRFGEIRPESSSVKKTEFPLLSLRSISKITQLMPFFRTLSFVFKAKGRGLGQTPDVDVSVEYPVEDTTRVLRELEENVESDFLESMSS
ncbi:protein DOP1B isoform X1 [Ranitomeya variabilis]|uniref:protein DOP1B isoform X1 n=1 Tax=Ranitomeya variabilis TaxID=490064 RepID=UPI0040579879